MKIHSLCYVLPFNHFTILLLLVDGNVFIASGSKDSYVRLWKISLKEDIKVKSDDLALEEQKFSVNQNGRRFYFNSQ